MLLLNIKFFMLSSKHARAAAIFLCIAALAPASASAAIQTNYYGPSGSEYSIVGTQPGDQVYPDLALSQSGGYLVWQDNVTDGSGQGISAERLTSTFSGTLSPFRVNVQGTNDQTAPKVAMLKNGGAAFVWQGGGAHSRQICARFLTSSNTWMSSTDLVVSTFTNTFQTTPALTVLNNSNVVVVWSSFDQAGTNSLFDVYGSILSPSGQVISNAFLINQFTSYNQRNPAVTALQGGGFAVAWVSEQEQSATASLGGNSALQAASALPQPSVDVYARLFSSNGAPAGAEFMVDQTGNPCASPVLAAASNGGFMMVWTAANIQSQANGWDIYACPVSSNGVAGSVVMVNTHVYGDQYAPKVSSIGLDFLVTWTSLGQDGSREGVYGQFVHDDSSMVGSEFRVNTTTAGQQMHATVSSDGNAWFQVVWTSFTGVYANGFDLYAQRYANSATVLQPMSAPYVYVPFNMVSNKYVPQLELSWPSVPGVSVANFQIFVDGSSTPTNLPATTNLWMMGPANGLTSSSTHSFQIGYVTTSGGVSPISLTSSGTTWSGAQWFGIPFEWMEAYYGYSGGSWPSNVNAPLVAGGMSLYNVFLSGGNPLDPSTWLATSISRTLGGAYLNWNTQAGMTYQVQHTADLKSWSNMGAARFAAGTTDSLYLGSGSIGFYRVLLLSQ